MRKTGERFVFSETAGGGDGEIVLNMNETESRVIQRLFCDIKFNRPLGIFHDNSKWNACRSSVQKIKK
jgi:hypothetical protein